MDLVEVSQRIDRAWQVLVGKEVTLNEIPSEVGKVLSEIAPLLQETSGAPMDLAWLECVSRAKAVLMSMAYNLGGIECQGIKYYGPDVVPAEVTERVFREQASLGAALGPMGSIQDKKG